MANQRAKGSEQKRDGLREAQRRFTRQHILDAAIEVFVERGYIASTVEDIIDRAGTSRATFYSYFRSKSDLIDGLNAVSKPAIRDSYRRLDEALNARSRQPLREWLVSTIDWCARYGGLMPVWEQARAIEPEQRAERQELLWSISDSMPQYLARWPKDTQKEARLRIALLSAQLEEFFLYAPAKDLDAADRAFLADVLTNMWYEPLQAPPLPSGSEHTATTSQQPSEQRTSSRSSPRQSRPGQRSVRRRRRTD